MTTVNDAALRLPTPSSFPKQTVTMAQLGVKRMLYTYFHEINKKITLCFFYFEGVFYLLKNKFLSLTKFIRRIINIYEKLIKI